MKAIEKLEKDLLGFDPSTMRLEAKVDEIIDVINELMKYGPGIDS
jgi:hypothetical protein